MLLLLIDVAYVRRVGSQCITFYSIVRLQALYGILYSIMQVNLGYAYTSGRPFRLLKRAIWQALVCCSVEDGTVLPNVVWREINYQSFEVREGTVVELKDFFSSRHFTTRQLPFHFNISSFYLLFFFFCQLDICLVYFLHTYVAPSILFNKFAITY